MSPRRTLLVFGACLVAVLAGVAWLSGLVLRLERAEREGRQRAATEANIRLALWRMDSALVPLIARESARPPSAYAPAASSPLLRERPEHVRLFFQVDGEALTSPEAPEGPLRQEALAAGADAGRMADAGARLVDLQRHVGAARLAAALRREAAPSDAAPGPLASPASDDAPDQKSLDEWQARSASVDTSYCQVDEAASGAAAALTPVWLAGELFLLRRVSLEGRDVVQGVWLDRAELARWLPTTVADLLPSARVEALLDAAAGPPHRLAALPLVLVPGPVQVELERRGASVDLVLAAAWAGVLLAALAVIALMAGTLSLSERRATFVSAVTHELRTPLTTLQTYAEMLLAGKVAEPEKRHRYLETLHREARRLSHLVENVLAYAGVERGRKATPAAVTLDVAALFERLAERLMARAAQDRATLTLDPGAGPLALRGDPVAIEQILFNLVDNACKYGGREPRIQVGATRAGEQVEIHVRDSGPGIAPELRRRLFEPFSKSAAQAAGAPPGVGLGLALSRGLARAMGGDLRLGASGSVFVLALPAGERARARAS